MRALKEHIENSISSLFFKLLLQYLVCVCVGMCGNENSYWNISYPTTAWDIGQIHTDLLLPPFRKCWQPFLEERNCWRYLLYILLSKQSQGPFFCFTFLCYVNLEHVHSFWVTCCRLLQVNLSSSLAIWQRRNTLSALSTMSQIF